MAIGNRYRLVVYAFVGQGDGHDDRPVSQRRGQRSRLKRQYPFAIGRSSFRKQENICLLFELSSHLFNQRGNQVLSLSINKDRSTQRLPRTDYRPAFDFPLGNKDDRKHAAQNDPVDVADMITNDDVTAPLRTSFFADNSHLDVENRAD